MITQNSNLLSDLPTPASSKGDGFAAILASLKDTLLKPVSFSALSDSLFTLGSRQPWQFGYDSLSRREREIYAEFSCHTVHPPAPANQHGASLNVGVHGYGKPVFTLAPIHEPSILIGTIPLDQDGRARLEACEQRARIADLEPRDEIDTLFAQLCARREQSREPEHDFIHIVKHGIDHIDPILIYVGDDVFTNFASFNNLLGKSSGSREGMLLDDLTASRSRTLTPSEREFLVCFYLLKRAGFRGEEFNGQQLRLRTLRTYFVAKLEELSTLARVSVLDPSADLLELALRCATLKQELRQTHFTYRKINGLCFNKVERYAPRSSLNISPEGLPASLVEPIHRVFGLEHSQYATVDAYFRALAKHACDLRDGDIRSIFYVDQLLELIVRGCMYELDADIGMTRGPRDWRFLQENVAASNHSVLTGASTQEYFCAVFASERTKKELATSAGLIVKVLKAISQRMMFNSWHYMPGYFAAPLADGDRHFYVPPRMSDTAVWSDQHHPGHVLARVRYSIRSPASVVLCGRKFPGIVDIRLMKSSGIPFTDSELLRAREYTGYIRALQQGLADECQARGKSYRITSFDKAWYDANVLAH
ncbi:MAG TPA: hypothetical protein VI299_15495 [Polyangiales bacterium]